MLFTYRRTEARLSLFLGTEQIREQDECVFLEVKIYNKLKFQSHIKTVNSEISKSIGTLFKLGSIFPLNILKIRYKILIIDLSLLSLL